MKRRGRKKKIAQPTISSSEVMDAIHELSQNNPSQIGKITGISEPNYVGNQFVGGLRGGGKTERLEQMRREMDSHKAYEDSPTKAYREATTREKLLGRINLNEGKIMDLQIETEKLVKLLNRLNENPDLELLINIQQGVY
jgi:hypothetical protein